MVSLLQTEYDFDQTIDKEATLSHLRLYGDADMFNRKDIIHKNKKNTNDYVPYSISLYQVRQDAIYHMMTLLRSPERFRSRLTINPLILHKLFPPKSTTTTKPLTELMNFFRQPDMKQNSISLTYYQQLLIQYLRENTFATKIFDKIQISYTKHYQTSDVIDWVECKTRKGLHHYIQVESSGIEKTLMITYKENDDTIKVLNLTQTNVDVMTINQMLDQSYCENQNMYYMVAMIYGYRLTPKGSMNKWCERFWTVIVTHYSEWVTDLLAESPHPVWSYVDEQNPITLRDIQTVIDSEQNKTESDTTKDRFQSWRLKKIGFLNEPIYLLCDPSPFYSLRVHHGIHLMQLAFYLARIQSSSVQSKSGLLSLFL